MGHSEYDLVAKERRPWNAGRKLGAKSASSPNKSVLSGFGLIGSAADAIQRSSISRSTASCAGANRQNQDRRPCQRRPGSLASYRSSTENRPPRSVRAPRACPWQSTRLVRMSRRHSRRLRLPEPDRSCRSYQHAAVCAARRRMGDRDRTAPGRRRNPFAPPNQGAHHLQANRKSTRRAILLGHTKIESRVRYLGVDIEDALALAEGTEV